MAVQRQELNRLEILRALRISNWEAVFSTVHATLTGGAFQTGFALRLGASSFWMGVLGSFPMFAGLVQILSSYFVERRGERKWFTAWFTGAARLLWLPILFVPWLPPPVRFPAFVILLLASSLLNSIPVPAFTSWLSDLVPPDHRGRYFGRRNMLAGITTMVVSLPAAWFLDLAVKRGLFPQPVGFAILFGIAVLCGIAGFICLTRQAEPPMQRMEAGDTPGLRGLIAFYRIPFREPNFRRLMFFSALFAAAQFFAAPFYTVYALQVLKLDYVWLQAFATLASLSSLLSMPLWGYLSDKFGNRPLLGISVFGIGILPLLWVFTSPEHMTASLVILCVNNLLGGLFWAGVGLTQFNLLISVTPAERKSVYIGAMSAVTGITGGLAPILGGSLVTALGTTTITVLGWTLGSYQILFVINALMRYSTLLALRRVRVTGSTTARDVLTQLGSSRVGSWMNIRRMHRAQSVQGKHRATQALRSARSTLAVEELIAALDDPSLHVREEAAEALGDIGDRRAIDALIAHLDDAASGIVDEAATALGRIGDERAVPALIKLLETGEKPDRYAAARALGRIGSPGAVPALLVVVESEEESPEVVEACVHALGAIGDPEAVPTLARCLPSAPRTLRLSAVRALGEIGDPEVTEPLLRQLAVEEDPALIAYIAVALAMIGAEEAVRPLLDALEKVESPVARKQILHAVGTVMDEEETFYPLLAMDSFARDEAVSRLLQEITRRTDSGTAGPLREKRRSRLSERLLELYLSGDYQGVLTRLTHRSKGVSDRPARAALDWAIETAQVRSLQPEEFLLALFAAHRLADERVSG